jgi:polyisoprenoid-binding protein YceI
MKKIIYPLLCALVITLPAFAFFAGNWKVKDTGYEVTFTGGRINGKFESLKADILFDKAHPEQAKISASIDVNSISTGFFLKTTMPRMPLVPMIILPLNLYQPR